MTILTVGSVEGTIVSLLTEDMQRIELPQSILPTLKPGSLLSVNIQVDEDAEAKVQARLRGIQKKMIDKYGQSGIKLAEAVTQPGFVKCTKRFHDSLVLSWTAYKDLPEMNRVCILKGIEVWCEGKRMIGAGFPEVDESSSVCRITSLIPGHPYKCKLVYRTTDGLIETEEIVAETRRLDDLSFSISAEDESSVAQCQLTPYESLQTEYLIVKDVSSDSAKAAREAHCKTVTKDWAEATFANKQVPY